MGRYLERIRQAEAMGKFALSEILRGIIFREHEIDLASALGIEVPPAKVPADRNGRHQVKDLHASR